MWIAHDRTSEWCWCGNLHLTRICHESFYLVLHLILQSVNYIKWVSTLTLRNGLQKCKENNLSLRFPVSFGKHSMLHYYLENVYNVDVTTSHPHCTFTDNLAAWLLSSLPCNLVANSLLNLIHYRIVSFFSSPSSRRYNFGCYCISLSWTVLSLTSTRELGVSTRATIWRTIEASSS